MKKAYFSLFLFFYVLLIHAQDVRQEKLYNESHADNLSNFKSSTITNDQNFILAGIPFSEKINVDDDLDYWSSKMDKKDNADWQKKEDIDKRFFDIKNSSNVHQDENMNLSPVAPYQPGTVQFIWNTIKQALTPPSFHK